ncbi:Sortase family protein [Pilibacter termitis]|uniref:Sortase family protein n=1 Tax=Pilibacter termitis TaxID=263852 RepID=A0A1T4QTM5_9ENTE|nr:sortase [Pilibacter termitis]SKA06821.1 Sortase family protein [Pilibacter termitis]
MKKRIRIIFFIVLVIGVIGGGVFYFLSPSNKSTEAEAAEEISLIQSSQKTVTSEESDANRKEPKLVQPKMQTESATTTSSSVETPEASSAPTETQSSEPAEVAQPAQSEATPPEESTPTTSSAVQQSSAQSNAVQANTIYVSGQAISYQNGGMANGQAIIDSDPNHLASTWGGASPFSGTDGLNTHFIGHHWGAFDPFIDLSVGGKITITDGNATPFIYQVNKTAIVDTTARDVATGKNLYSEITSTGGGERVVFQTCTSETERKILFANIAG